MKLTDCRANEWMDTLHLGLGSGFKFIKQNPCTGAKHTCEGGDSAAGPHW